MTTKNPIELLKTIYGAVDNGHKSVVKEAADAVKEIQAELSDLKSSLDRQPLPEAPACVNFRMVHRATQVECQFTLRGHSETELQERLARRIAGLTDSGFVAFDVYVDQRRADRQQDAPAVAGKPVAALAIVPRQGQTQESLTFRAKTLEATASGGKSYWKVKGGRFEKFGVTVWPEVLEETGFNLDELDPLKVYQLEDYTATYVTKDGGKPDKIIKLEKAA